jgi:putative spermidine/putrescine transport system ATP-binding protein
MAELELVNVAKRFKQADAVRNVSIKVGEGEFFSLLGPSGCGKTTTLRLIAGFIAPSVGQILLDGQDITPLPPERRDMGIVFQNYALFPHMTVFDNIAFGLRMRGMSRDDIQRQVRAALDQVDLHGYEERYEREMSGGERQRVALARALVIEPRLLLLDEPLGALDKKLREEIKYWIKDLQQQLGITTLYITHDQSEAMALSDRIGVMHQGRIEQIGRPPDIYEQPATRFVSSFIGESNLLTGQVARLEGKWVWISLAEGLELPARTLNGLQPGQVVSLIVRPENVLLAAQPASLADGVVYRQGSVLNEVYQGAIIRYQIALPGDHTLIAESPNTAERESLAVGTTVTVGWHPESATVLIE